MKIFKRVNELTEYLTSRKKEGLVIGFVPTMGALHRGHISLIEEAARHCDITVCSIFVNPIQFNNPNDLAKYPRNLDKDVALLASTQCNVVFAPSVDEVYPQPDNTKFDFGEIEKVMEGKFRPGHFNGVAVVVRRLFEIVRPDLAFFGEKDFQQLTIIKRMVQLLNLPMKIVGCPTLPDTDGLALSSRNTMLSAEERASALKIPALLKKVKSEVKTKSIEQLKREVENEINATPLLKLEYFEIARADNLQPVSNLSDINNLRAFIACYAGKTRLIDNISLI
jgi:pantoate--beta-alanine ligase